MDEDPKSIIRSLVASTPLATTIRTLLKDFRDTMGFDLPYKQHGFQNPEQYLRSIPDVVQIVGNGPNAEVQQVRSKKLDHINEMVSRQRMPKAFSNRRRQIPRAKIVGTTHAPPRRHVQPLLSSPLPPPNFSYPNNYYSHLSPLFAGNFQAPVFNPVTHHSNTRRSYSRMQQQNTKHLNSKHQLPKPKPVPVLDYAPEPSGFEEIRTSTPVVRDAVEPKPLPAQIQPPVLDYASKPSVFDEIRTSTPIIRNTAPPLAEGNSITPVRQLNMLPHISNCSKSSLSADEDVTFYDEVEDRVPFEVKNNLRNLIGDHPEGIWCCDLPKLYRSRYLTELDYTCYKFRTLNEMCLYLASIFHYIRPDKGDFKLYDKRKPIPQDLSLEFCKTTEAGNETLRVADDLEIPSIEELALSDEPSNVVQYLEDIPRQWLTEKQIEGTYIDVEIAELYDPSKFWFIICKDKLNAMMDEMQSYYNDNKDMYEIPPNKLKEGLFCCAVFFGEYHRAVIIAKSSTPKEDKIKLYFIDFGTVAKVPVKGICYLHRKFMALPQQAIRGRLAGLYPPNAQQQWSRAISARLFELVERKELVARIEKINLQKQLVHLVLIEPKGSRDQDIYINDVLIKEGLAVASPEEQKEVEMSKYAVPIVRHLHLYPTFEEIEQGLVPSAPEMINLLNNGCSLELIYPQYFRRCYYKHEMQKLRSEMLSNYSSDDPDAVEAKSSSSSSQAEEKSASPREFLNFTEDPIADKGGTRSSGTDTEMEVIQDNPPTVRQDTSGAISSNTEQTRAVVAEEVGEESRALKPPPGFENVRPTVNVQQTFMMQPPNYGYFRPLVQQNYFFHSYQNPYYPVPYEFSPSLPYGHNYSPMMHQAPFQEPQQPQPTAPQGCGAPPLPTPLIEAIVSQYLGNFLKNGVKVSEPGTIGKVSCGESTDESDVVLSGSLAKKWNIGNLRNSAPDEESTKKSDVNAADQKVQEERLATKETEESVSSVHKEEIIQKEHTARSKKKRRKQKKQQVTEVLPTLQNSQDVLTAAIQTTACAQTEKTSKSAQAPQKDNGVLTYTAINKKDSTIPQSEVKDIKEQDAQKKSNIDKDDDQLKILDDRVKTVASTNKNPHHKEETSNQEQSMTKTKETTAKKEVTDATTQKEDLKHIRENEGENEEFALDEDQGFCLLDVNETQLDMILHRPQSRISASGESSTSVVIDEIVTVVSKKEDNRSQPEDILECEKDVNTAQEQISETNKRSKLLEEKVIAGKTMTIVTWDQKRYFVLDEVLKKYADLQLPVTSSKMLLARRKIFVKDVDVDLLNEDVRKEFSRNELVTKSKFGAFVHLIELEMLPNFVKTFDPEVEFDCEDFL